MTVKVSIRELRAASFAEVSVTSDIGQESSCIRWRIGPGTSVDHRSCSLTLFEKQWASFQIREIRIGGKFAGSSSARNKRVFRSSFSFFFLPFFFRSKTIIQFSLLDRGNWGGNRCIECIGLFVIFNGSKKKEIERGIFEKFRKDGGKDFEEM